MISECNTPKLLQACKESANSYLYCIVLIALTTGARKGEILSLKWADIDFDNQVAFLRETKNGHPRTIFLVDEIIKELKIIYKNKRPNKELIFTGKTAFGKIDIKKPWKKALKQANIKGFVFHSCRHQFSTMAAKQGASILELQTATGHRDMRALKGYVHLESNITKKFSENISNQILGGQK